MPPLPTSLIVVGLVAAWLVVLVPMVAKRREHVPESDEDSAGFRVLRRASQSLRRRPVLSRTAMAERADDDRYDDELEDRYDDELDDRYDGRYEDRYEDGADDQYDRYERDQRDRDGDDRDREPDNWDRRADDRKGDEVTARFDDQDEPVERVAGAEFDDAEFGDGRVGDDARADRDDLPGDEAVGGGDLGDDAADDGAPHRAPERAPMRAPALAAVEQPMLDERWEDIDDDRHRPELRDAADEWAAEHQSPRASDTRRADRRDRRRDAEPRRRDPGWGRDEPSEDSWERERYSRAEHRDDEARFRPVPVRAGRGGFDPRAAEQAKAYRYRQRRRVALVLLALAVVCAGVGVLGITLAWAGAVVSVVLLAMYMAYLRRQVRIEEAIRQRRAARLERARQIRPVYRASVAEQVRAHRTGSLARPEPDEEPVGRYRVSSHARPTSTVPPVSYTRGVPVDLDDDDPAFDDLEYYRPVTYRRAVGE